MKLIKDSIVYALSSALSKGMPFLMLPFFTFYLQKEEFGTLVLFLSISSIFLALIGMSFGNLISKEFHIKNKKEISVVIGSVLYLLLINSGVSLFLAIFAYTLFDNIFSIPSIYLIAIPFIVFGAMVNQIILVVFRCTGMAIYFGILEFLTAFLTFLIVIFSLIYLDQGWLSQVIGMMFGINLVALFSIYYLYKHKYLSLKFHLYNVLKAYKFLIPLIPHVLGSVLIFYSDRFFIDFMIGTDEVAIYSLGYSFGMAVFLFTNSILKAWDPWFHKQIVKSSKEKIDIVKKTYILIIVFLFFGWLVTFVGESLLPYVTDGNYIGSSDYIRWIAMGFSIHGIYGIFFLYVIHLEKTYILGLVTTFSALINLLLNYILIIEFGAIGVAYATIIAFTISAILLFEFQRRNLHMPWMDRKLLYQSSN